MNLYQRTKCAAETQGYEKLLDKLYDEVYCNIAKMVFFFAKTKHVWMVSCVIQPISNWYMIQPMNTTTSYSFSYRKINIKGR